MNKLFSNVEMQTEVGNLNLLKAQMEEAKGCEREILLNSINHNWNAPSKEDLEDYTEDDMKELLGWR